MKDDYLWDGSGERDEEVARLEELLGRYRHEAPLRRRAWGRRSIYLAAAAALILFVAAGVFATFVLRFKWPAGTPWDITDVVGTPTVAGKVVDDKDRLTVGETLRTDGQSSVTVRVARVGEVEVAPNSELVLTHTGDHHRMALRRGAIRARVWAPPFMFGVRTPAGVASDLGCVFELSYEKGEGVVRVLSGWVEFESSERESLIPSGAMAVVREPIGPGTPFYPETSPAFRAALVAFDFDGGPLGPVLAEARAGDAMTLLHILERADTPAQRAAIYDRLAVLAPPPPGVTREGVMAEDWTMFNRWRDSLGVGGIKKWWLNWRDAL